MRIVSQRVRGVDHPLLEHRYWSRFGARGPRVQDQQSQAAGRPRDASGKVGKVIANRGATPQAFSRFVFGSAQARSSIARLDQAIGVHAPLRRMNLRATTAYQFSCDRVSSFLVLRHCGARTLQPARLVRDRADALQQRHRRMAVRQHPVLRLFESDRVSQVEIDPPLEIVHRISELLQPLLQRDPFGP